MYDNVINIQLSQMLPLQKNKYLNNDLRQFYFSLFY